MLPFRHLPPALGREVFAHLCDCLPPPHDHSQAARDARDTIAMAQVVGYDPIDMIEAMLAIRIVAAEAHARDAFRLVGVNAGDLKHVARCRAQAAMMMRAADKARAELRDCRKERPAIASDQPGTRPIATAKFVPAAEPPPERPPERPAAPPAPILVPLSATPTHRDRNHTPTPAEVRTALTQLRRHNGHETVKKAHVM